MKYFMTEKRDGQVDEFKLQLIADNMEQAISEFSKIILNEIARGIEYSYFGSENELKESFPDYQWQGCGYYALPDTPIAGRELFYSKDAKFESYREDVYTYGVKEVGNESQSEVGSRFQPIAELPEEQVKAAIAEILEESINDAFNKSQTKFGIKSGDIDPADNHKAEELSEQLIELIYRQLLFASK